MLNVMKVVVIDDDPTGSQTVHGCLLLLHWDVSTLRYGLRHSSPLLFILAGTRAMSAESAAARNQEICYRLDFALSAESWSRHNVLLVSRSDSTLRGHGVLEPTVLAACFGPFDATLHVPAFLEGGRTTVGGVHRLYGKPVHMSPFAQDQLFRYSTSNLADWLEERSNGTISAAKVDHLSLKELDAAAAGNGGMVALTDHLRRLTGNQIVVVDAERQQQLIALSNAVQSLNGERRFLFRAAASLVKALANLEDQPMNAQTLARLRRRNSCGEALPGLVLVGSYLPLADQQLKKLLAVARCKGIELSAQQIARVVLKGPAPDLLMASLERYWCNQIDEALEDGCTPVLFTSRGELSFTTKQARRYFSNELAQLTGRLAGLVAPRLGYLISKGGTTTQALLANGLGLALVQLEGQLLPGLSLVRSLDKGNLQNLPILTFPGNLGDENTLLESWLQMEVG